MQEVDVVSLEDGNDYIILGETTLNNEKYVLLSQEEDETKICIRKIVYIDNEEYFETVEDNNLVKNIMSKFTKNFSFNK